MFRRAQLTTEQLAGVVIYTLMGIVAKPENQRDRTPRQHSPALSVEEYEPKGENDRCYPTRVKERLGIITLMVLAFVSWQPLQRT